MNAYPGVYIMQKTMVIGGRTTGNESVWGKHKVRGKKIKGIEGKVKRLKTQFFLVITTFFLSLNVQYNTLAIILKENVNI